MNKQTKSYKGTGFCTRNGGANPIISKVEHGPFAFQHPDRAIARKRAAGCHSWRVTKRHPNNSSNNKTRY